MCFCMVDSLVNLQRGATYLFSVVTLIGNHTTLSAAHLFVLSKTFTLAEWNELEPFIGLFSTVMAAHMAIPFQLCSQPV